MPITADNWKRVQALFTEAVAKAPEDRPAFLEQVCGGDAELRADVESLLRYDSEAGEDFLRPVVPPSGRLLGTVFDGPDPLIGARIARYTVESIIAAGGMGTVYLARQDNPAREVALKVMHAGMFARSTLKRFEHEAQILARLRHPNIAQIYDAGVAEVSVQQSAIGDQRSGDVREPAKAARTMRVPYFAMEYIPQARSLTAYAAAEKLNLRQRLGLFIQVCDAVQHGHQKGIIHRDLKPANILVDAEGHTKVIDFGVARSTDADIAVTTMRTDVGQLVGTVQYMSPEQCEGDPNEIDVRSDVYSLGVVLYELLCGRLPYDVSRTSIYEATRTIREEEPVRPSNISGGDTPGAPGPVKGDIETVVLKALEKDRARRYQSVVEMAEDIRRVLSNEPISARPPSLRYQAGKFARRNKALVGGIVATMLALIGGLVGMTWYARHAVKSSKDAIATAEKLSRSDYRQRIVAAQGAINERRISQAWESLTGTEQRLRGWEWRYLETHLRQSLWYDKIDGEHILNIAIDPTGRLVALCLAQSDVVRVCDVAHLPESGAKDPAPVISLASPSGYKPNAAAFSHDGDLLAVAFGRPLEWTSPSRLCVYQVGGASLEIKLDTLTDAPGISELTFHPKRKLLAGAAGATIRLWDMTDPQHTDQRPVAILTGHDETIRSIAFSPDGKRLASGSVDYTARLWDVDQALLDPQHAQLAVLRGHTDHVSGVAWSPDSALLASASLDRTIRVWDVKASLRQSEDDRSLNDPTRSESTGVCRAVITGHEAGVQAVAFDPTSPRLISAGDDRTIRIWEVNQAATTSNRLMSRDWRVLQINPIQVLRGHDWMVDKLAVLPDGRIISVALIGAEIALWHQDVVDIPRLEGHNTSVEAVAFTPDDRYIVSADGGYGIFIWDADLCVPVGSACVRAFEGIYSLACWQRDGHTFLAAGTGNNNLLNGPPQRRTGRILFWSLDDPTKPRSIASVQPISPTAFLSIAVSADGRRMVAGDIGGRVRAWDVADLQAVREIASFPAYRSQVACLVFLDEAGQWLASGCGDRFPSPGISEGQQQEHMIKLWDLDSGREVWRYEAHSDAIASLARRPSGGTATMLASASYDKSVSMWAIKWRAGAPALVEAGKLSGHTDLAAAVVFHPTEPRLASGSFDRTIKLWDLGWMVDVVTLRGHVGSVGDLAFSSDGKRLASASRGSSGTDNVVYLWEENVTSDLRERRAVAMRAYGEVRHVFTTAVSSIDDARRKIERNDRLPADVKAVALERFDTFLPIPHWLDRRARDVFSRNGPTEAEYRQALAWAKKASEIGPEWGPAWNTRGIIEYRLKRDEDAIKSLERSAELSIIMPRRSNWACLALIYHRLGRSDDEKRTLEELRKLVENPRQIESEEESKEMIDQALQLLKSPPTETPPQP